MKCKTLKREEGSLMSKGRIRDQIFSLHFGMSSEREKEKETDDVEWVVISNGASS
jgi:hypothetical protein